MESAGFWTSGFWLALFIGRVVLRAVSDRIGADLLVLVDLLGVVTGACIFAFAPSNLVPVGLLVAGVTMAPVFPLLMHKTPRIFGNCAARMVGLQVGAAMAGGVIVPTVLGALAEPLSLGVIPLCLLTLSALLVLLAFVSHRLSTQT